MSEYLSANTAKSANISSFWYKVRLVCDIEFYIYLLSIFNRRLPDKILKSLPKSFRKF